MNEAFNEFRELYPRQGDETQTFREWIKHTLSGVKPQDIVDGARFFRDYCDVTAMQTHFIPMPWRWLREKRWLERPVFKAKKTWTPPAVPTRRWTAQEAHEPILSKPIAVKPIEAVEPPKPFRSAKEILACRAKG